MLLALLLLAAVLVSPPAPAHCCTTVEVRNEAAHAVGRTLELGFDWALHGQYELEAWPRGTTDPGQEYGMLVVAAPLGAPMQYRVVLDGMNAYGLTISAQTFHLAGYQDEVGDAEGKQVVGAIELIPHLLGRCQSVKCVRRALEHEVRVVQRPARAPPAIIELFKIHWAVQDFYGASIVVEYMDGVLHIHDNSAVGVMTNDPDFTWHLRNVNHFLTITPDPPVAHRGVQCDTEIGPIPSTQSHGFNLRGLPGDLGPSSRFVRMFYFRQFSVARRPPTNSDEAIALVTQLLNNVAIPMGSVAPLRATDSLELTQWSLIKLPRSREVLWRTYSNAQWRKVRLDALDLQVADGPIRRVPLDVAGENGVRDATADFLTARDTR